MSRKYRVRKEIYTTVTGAQWPMWFLHFPAYMHREPLTFWNWDIALWYAIGSAKTESR